MDSQLSQQKQTAPLCPLELFHDPQIGAVGQELSDTA